MLTANNIWGNGDNADYGNPANDCGQWVANFWLNYPLSGTATAITVEYEQPNNSCSGGYGVVVFDACANTFIPFIGGTQTNGATAITQCGAQGFRHPCTTPGVYSGQFDASGVSDLSCLWVVSWAHSRFASTSIPATTGVDMVQNVMMNGVMPTSASSCTWNNIEAVLADLNGNDFNGNNWYQSGNSVCTQTTFNNSDLNLYGDLVTSEWTCTPSVTSEYPSKFVPVTLVKNVGAKKVAGVNWDYCVDGSKVKLVTWDDNTTSVHDPVTDSIVVGDLGCCDCEETNCAETIWTIYSKLPNPHPDFTGITFIGNIDSGTHPITNDVINGWNVFQTCSETVPLP